MKTVQEVYEDKEVLEENGAYVCPVCRKSYQRRKYAEKHLESQQCHSVYDIFGETEYEKAAFLFYCNIQAEKNSKLRPSMKSFRKSSLYKNCVSYVVSCMANDIDAGLMYSFLNEIAGFSYPNAIMKKGMEREWIRNFRMFLHNNPEVSDSKEFYEQYKDVLLDDEDFLIQSIERAKISIGFIDKRKKLLRAVDKLPIGYKTRLIDVCNEAEESKW